MKSLLLLFFISVFTVNSHAQVISNYGIKLGVGISNQSWEATDYSFNDWHNQTGISPRIFADFFTYPVFQLEGEVGYMRKGFQFDLPITTAANPDVSGGYYNQHNRLDYMTISLSARFRREFQYVTPFVMLGPQLNILINKNIDKGYDWIFDNYRKNIAGISAGCGVELKNILPFTILLEYRYETDFSNNYNYFEPNIKNYSHVLLVGIKI